MKAEQEFKSELRQTDTRRCSWEGSEETVCKPHWNAGNTPAAAAPIKSPLLALTSATLPACLAVPTSHTHTFTHTCMLNTHCINTHWFSKCLSYTAVDVAIVIVLWRALQEPTVGSAVLLAPQRQHLLSSFALSLYSLLPHPPPTYPDSLASNFCPYVTLFPVFPTLFRPPLRLLQNTTVFFLSHLTCRPIN